MPQNFDDRKWLPFQSIEEATNFLIRATTPEGVLHLSYWYLQYVEGSPDQVIWVATYDPSYMSFYMTHFTPLDDPVIGQVMDNKLVDWAEWFQTDQVAQLVSPVMARFGITKYGVSVPLFVPGDDKIIFSACIASSDSDWPYQRNALARRMTLFAQTFDLRMRYLVNAGQEALAYSNVRLRLL